MERLSLFLIGAAMMQEPSERNWGLFTVLVGIVAAVVWILPRKGAAIPEIFASLAASAWSMAVGIRLYKQASHSIRYPYKIVTEPP